MIPDELVETINDVRFVFRQAIEQLPEVSSFKTLLATSTTLTASLAEIASIARSRHLVEPCDGRITCAIVGSSGHGKTTVMDEMFPGLSERGWLVTDVTDTTSQSLRIEHANPDSPEADEVEVDSWNAEQIKELMRHPEVEEQNRRDEIRVNYLENGVEVDGSEAKFAPEDLAEFRFARKIALEPFPRRYRVGESERTDRRFIRALTVKEQSGVMATGPILNIDGQSYNALQLRAMVKDVRLRDGFERIKAWSGRDDDAVARLTFVDTPGLAVNGSVKDEVLRHFLEKKSDHIALQLWKADELDIVVHLVLCGRQSDFAVLWKAIERECGPAEMKDLAERMVLAVNGMNIYFTNRDVRSKYEDPETARREGDHFATTLVDNVLQKMSPRGKVRPARICFLDSASIVETLTTGTYAEAYEHYRPIMEGWVEEGGIGRKTLEEIGLLEDFRQNIAALADPDDRGQGFLVRQIMGLLEEKGPRLLLKKYLVRTGLLGGVEELLGLIRVYYDDEGKMNREAVQQALRSCLSFLDSQDLTSIEHFASDVLDPRIEEIVPRDGVAQVNGWVGECFGELCSLVKDSIADRSGATGEIAGEFNRHFDSRATEWRDRWGYETAKLTPPDKGFANTGDLVTHCLKLHGREILYQLLVVEAMSDEAQGLEQTEEDQQQIANLMGMLEEARLMGQGACTEHGVEA